ncbi:MAG: hypothetical protein EPN82_02360 [Bacteroidetes bacterium]|nr:MAG: hypothetical protein EPN82_02360 [Bacteroidota bacterium]
MKKYFTALFILLYISVIISSCATISSEWEKAKSINTIDAYNAFIENHRGTLFADSAIIRLQYLNSKEEWEETLSINTIDAYDAFIVKNPVTIFKDSALNKLQYLYSKSVQDAVSNTLPIAKLDVDLVNLYTNKSEFVIFEHILEEHSSEDPDPIVRGDYNTLEKLEELVKSRCSKILSAVITKATFPKECILSVEMRHGVRLIDPVTRQKIRDEAKTLFKVNISKETIKKHDWSNISNDEVMKLWSVKENIIPKLIITTEY